jgi:hypothetical protein
MKACCCCAGVCKSSGTWSRTCAFGRKDEVVQVWSSGKGDLREQQRRGRRLDGWMLGRERGKRDIETGEGSVVGLDLRSDRGRGARWSVPASGYLPPLLACPAWPAIQDGSDPSAHKNTKVPAAEHWSTRNRDSRFNPLHCTELSCLACLSCPSATVASRGGARREERHHDGGQGRQGADEH